jgi:hypothetical protein
MKANELRIGNWYQDNFGEQYGRITGHDIGDLAKGLDCEAYQPIELTSEILTKNIGFNIKQTKWRTLYKYGKISLDKTLYGKTSFSFCFGHHGIMGIDYVHQLQNLYFALTGEELNIEL